jgi:hypothetical protein
LEQGHQIEKESEEERRLEETLAKERLQLRNTSEEELSPALKTKLCSGKPGLR